MFIFLNSIVIPKINKITYLNISIMVVEQLIKASWLEKRPLSAFTIGFIYSLIAFLTSYLIFPSYFGIMSIAFISILLVPTLSKLLSIEENQEIREKKFSIPQLLKDHYDIIEIYLFLFMGIFLAYFLLTLFIPPSLGVNLFSPQLDIAGISGFAFNTANFWQILFNNLIVLAVAFILSLVYGAGAILFLSWNASVWGVVIGAVLRRTFGLKLLPITINFSQILPHLTIEATGYILAAITGGILSKAVIRESYKSKQFMHILTDALLFGFLSAVLILIASVIEIFVITT